MTRPPSKPRAKRSGPGGARPGAGRPARGEAATPLQIRVTVDERKALEMAAQREGKSLSEWARNALLLRAAANG